MKWELEDLSLKYLDPIGYQEISDELDRQAKAHAAFMEHIQEEITSTAWRRRASRARSTAG